MTLNAGTALLSVRRLLTVCVIALSLALPATVAARTSSVDSSGNLFVQTETVEFAASSNGHFGSCLGEECGHAPDGFHANASSLGFMAAADPENPSWVSPLGDFFAPGDPYEAWVLTADGFRAENSNAITSIPGSWEAPAEGAASWVWNSTEPWHGLAVTQTVDQTTSSTLVNVAVRLTNVTDSPITGVAYGRAVDPDNCASRDDDFDTSNRVIAQAQLADGKSIVTASKTCDPEGNPVETVFGLGSRDNGSVVNNQASDFDPAFDLSSDPVTTGDVSDGDSSITISIPAKPDADDTLAPGASVTLHFSYFMNAGDPEKGGLTGAESILTPKPAEFGIKLAPSGFLAFTVGGATGRTYEVSADPSFAKLVTFGTGSTGRVQVAKRGFGKGKVGSTTIYVRDKAVPARVLTVDMPWDFSLPYLKWGSVRTVRDSTGKVLKGRWGLRLSARDTAPAGSSRGLWAELSYDSAKPSAIAPFPSELFPDVVIPVSGFYRMVWHPVPPRWVRLGDAAGNRSPWYRLASLGALTVRRGR